MTLKERYKALCEEYVTKLAHMYDLSNNHFWIADEVGGTLCIDIYYIDFSDVRRIVDNGIDYDTFSDWYDYCELCLHQDVPDVNLKTWCNITENKRKSLINALRYDN